VLRVIPQHKYGSHTKPLMSTPTPTFVWDYQATMTKGKKWTDLMGQVHCQLKFLPPFAPILSNGLMDKRFALEFVHSI
jgi:hypothetical protein